VSVLYNFGLKRIWITENRSYTSFIGRPFQLLWLFRHWGLTGCRELPAGGHRSSPGCCCLPGAAIALTCHAFKRHRKCLLFLRFPSAAWRTDERTDWRTDRPRDVAVNPHRWQELRWTVSSQFKCKISKYAEFVMSFQCWNFEINQNFHMHFFHFVVVCPKRMIVQHLTHDIGIIYDFSTPPRILLSECKNLTGCSGSDIDRKKREINK